MGHYFVYEGYMPELRKRVATIERKCAKLGCDFSFAEVGEELRTIEVEDEEVTLKYIEVEAEGTAIVNGWRFIASVEHTSAGNVFRKALDEVEIPERYRNCELMCEHCHTDRERTSAFIVYDMEHDDFKMVGRSCLTDYTRGMSVSAASYMASLRNIFVEFEEEEVTSGYIGYGSGRGKEYFDTDAILRYAAETIRHFGYVKSEDARRCTSARLMEYYKVDTKRTRTLHPDVIAKCREEMDKVRFNAKSDEAKQMVEDALLWLSEQNADNDYMHNLKVVAQLPNITWDKIGILASLFPTYDRSVIREAERKARAEACKDSVHVGAIGDKLTIDVASARCATSWETEFGLTFIWEIIGTDGNVYTWKTSKWINIGHNCIPDVITGKVKDHSEFRDVKQTELTRCRMFKGGKTYDPLER